jgi:hypothetical protein
MSQKIYEETNIQNIANAIRSKLGSAERYTVSDMANAIMKIKAPPDLEVLNASENGDYLSTKDGFSEVHVNVPKDIALQEVTVTSNGVVTPSEGYDGLIKVIVSVDVGRTPRSYANCIDLDLIDSLIDVSSATITPA